MTVNLWIILGGALMTYVARAGGHLVLSRFKTIHPRVQAGLDAVPAAVLTTLVAPAAFNGGLPELAALLVAGLVALRAGMIPLFLAGAVVLILLRQLVG
ncbi:AzlD family protein [Chelativorans sp. ZYF759]|uniref:AzlD family protein n=1 Tax=Chelativorans sp. ZYF759 TaxID=2692213 RepID=UPI00145EDCAC|nr:AzlD family protein [Chelativorans sp. ZYF759]NMG41508.1 AzlD family protein [Chelativorans sp. ZYF759]